MELSYVIFTILVGSVFVLFVCMKGLFDVAMTRVFDPRAPIDVGDIKRSLAIASLALILSIICWSYL